MDLSKTFEDTLVFHTDKFICKKQSIPGPFPLFKAEEGDAGKTIIQKRQNFEELVLKYKGPAMIPTVFRNNPDRYVYVREEEEKMKPKISHRNPPPEPLSIFTFSGDLYKEIVSKFKNDSFKAFIKPDMSAEVIYLNKQSCGEQAFQEMLSCEPYFYSEDFERYKLSRYVNLYGRKKGSLPPPCRNKCEFIVDFSVVFPDGKASTAVVICYDCGEFVETVICDNIIEKAKREMWYNICNPEVKFGDGDSDPLQYVINLPIRATLIDTCAFVEGMMGMTTLTRGKPSQPSVFVRTRLFYYCNQRSVLSSVIHDCKVEKGVRPSHKEYMKMFGLR